MSTPKPKRPTLDDDLSQAYAQSQALAGAARKPAPAVRANVLAAAREMAAQAAAQRAGTPEAPSGATPHAPPPLVPVAPPVADVGRGRARAGNLSSWRVRSGAALCAVLLVGLMAVRFDANRKSGENVTLAAADSSLAMRVIPSPPPADRAPLPKNMPSPVVREPTLAAPAPAAPARSATRDPERAVAKPDAPMRAREQTRIADARTSSPEGAANFAAAAAAAPTPAPTSAPAPAPAPVLAAADKVGRAEVTGSLDFSGLRASSEITRKAAPAAVGSATATAVARPSPTPLHVAANADDTEALRRLLADPDTRVDATDAIGRTALQYAVMAANVRAVRLLLAAGADPDHADASGATPRGVARTGVSAEIAALLAPR